uniref:Uncharacterized protein n=1 Tax=Heterorhabditis bacteriophora TaxID=37862 RepID=A0A1I7WGP7_HETBA
MPLQRFLPLFADSSYRRIDVVTQCFCAATLSDAVDLNPSITIQWTDKTDLFTYTFCNFSSITPLG